MAIKSAGDMDPQYLRKQLNNQRRVNNKNARILASLRAANANPNRPAFLDRVRKKEGSTERQEEKIVDYKRTISRAVNSHINKKA